MVAGKDSPECVCDHGFDGIGCEKCLPKFTGDLCDRCEDNYIGYNTDCSVSCVNGYATVEGGRICACYDDEVNGHWDGGSCDECMSGFQEPSCILCTSGKMSMVSIVISMMIKDKIMFSQCKRA